MVARVLLLLLLLGLVSFGLAEVSPINGFGSIQFGSIQIEEMG